MLLAEIIVYTIGIYLGIGVAFALYFVIFGIAKLDQAAKGTSIFFRFLIFFGAVPFWLLLAWRLIAGAQRPTEKTAHRQTVREEAK